MDALITTQKNGKVHVLLITEHTSYDEIKNEITLAESHKFIYCNESNDFRKRIFNLQGDFNKLKDMLQDINLEGKLTGDQKRIFVDFQEKFDNLMNLF